MCLTAKATTYERPIITASPMTPLYREMDWTPPSWKDIEAEIEQKKKDNKLHIEVRRKDLFR